MSAQDQTYPRIERACNIEVPYVDIYLKEHGDGAA